MFNAKLKPVEEYINQVDDLVHLENSGHQLMTGKEPWLEYDNLQVFTRLLAINNVPHYYFAEFIHGI